MKKLSLFVLSLFLISCSGESSQGTQETLAPEHQNIQALYSSQLDCSEGSKDLQRSWCPVTLVGDFELKLPEEETTYLGLSMFIYAPSAVNHSNSPFDFDTTSFSVLHLGPDEAKLTSVIPENDEESEDIAAAVFNVAGLLKVSMANEGAVVSSDLWEYLLGEQAEPGHPLTVETMSASFEGDLLATLYYVEGEPYGAAYIVFEDAGSPQDGGYDAPNDYYVSIFPIVEWTAK